MELKSCLYDLTDLLTPMILNNRFDTSFVLNPKGFSSRSTLLTEPARLDKKIVFNMASISQVYVLIGAPERQITRSRDFFH